MTTLEITLNAVKAYSQTNSKNTQKEKDKNETKPDNSPAYLYEKTDLSLTLSTYGNEKKSTVIEQPPNTEKNLLSGSAQEKERIKNEIIEQTRALLAEFFEENPEALKDIEAGKIPDHFNAENTARRILNIYFSRYEGEDPKTFVEQVRALIEQAYQDVEQIIGGELPGIVQETRELIFDLLDDFAEGEDISEFLNEE